MDQPERAFPLILNKVAPPRYVTPTLRRARLLDWLHERAACRAIVVAADAGYGKTTLLWQWEREVSFPCYWYKLDRSDRDWSFHITYLIEAIRQRHEGFGQRTASMLRELGGPGTSRPGVAAYLVSEMHQFLTEPCTFIIDDWQAVSSVTEVRGLWNQILRDAPPTCRFVFASRAKPHLQFARFKTHGGYAELRTNALRFTDREIDQLFRDVYQDPLEPGELTELDRRTEGWAASLQLVEVSLRERKSPEDRLAFIESISAGASDSDLFEFLAEEVLDQLTDDVRNLLLSTSILMQISPELAERLAGVHDGERQLADLEQRGLFTYRVDEHRYRYHNLFREFLERRLARERGEAEITGLHIHAASYYETNAEWPLAIHHYLKAELHRQAARLIARHGEDVVAEGHLGMVDQWLQQLPTRMIRENARLSLLQGQAFSMRGEYALALDSLNRARGYFARKGDHLMEATACVNLSSLHLHHGESAMAASIADDGLALAPENAAAVRLRLRGNIAVTRTWLDNPSEAATALKQIAREAEARRLLHYAAIADHNYGALTRDLGQLQESVTALRRAHAYWSGGDVSPFADNLELVLTLLALDAIDEAESVALNGMARTRPWPLPRGYAEMGFALVLQAKERFEDAAGRYMLLAQHEFSEGLLREIAYVALAEVLVLARASPERIRDAYHRLDATAHDPRYRLARGVATAIARHYSEAECSGECRAEWLNVEGWMSDWPGAGSVAALKLSVVKLDHGAAAGAQEAVAALRQLLQHGGLAQARNWISRLADHVSQLARVQDFADVAMTAADMDPSTWRAILPHLIPHVAGTQRGRLLSTISKVADASTAASLARYEGSDVDDTRRELRRSLAPKLFIRTLGCLAVHKGGWDAPPILVDKKRLRTLLGLLAVHIDSGISRDSAMDLLWPESDPAASLNNLNQSLYKLRRFLDPSFRDGESPMYVIADADTIRLDSELVRTDVGELRRWASILESDRRDQSREAAAAIIGLTRGELLPELRYDDWLSGQQLATQEELRRMLLPIAMGAQSAVDPLLASHAAAVLVSMDPLDEAANVALAVQLAITGRRPAAKAVMERYVALLDRELGEKPGNEALVALNGLALGNARSISN